MGDEQVDSQHKDLFILADQLVASTNREELIKSSRLIYQHVKEHFCDEEELMKKSGFRNYKDHLREHNAMLEKLADMDHKITNDDWKQNDIQEFMDRWVKHIINSDMAFDAYHKEQKLDAA
jgi:putative two-component system hydrogenase maturation factor HypX/HoxX